MRDGEQKRRKHDVKDDGNDVAPQQRVAHDHSDRVNPTGNPQRRRKPSVTANEVAAASRELRGDGREQTDYQYLRCEQQRIRQQTGLPFIHRRQEWRNACDDEELAEHAEYEEREQNPQDRGAASRLDISCHRPRAVERSSSAARPTATPIAPDSRPPSKYHRGEANWLFSSGAAWG